MGKVTGFLEIKRKKRPTRPVDERLRDWKEVYLPFPVDELKKQAARCMDCGIPFCHQGCPLGNIIPDWNDLVYRDHWRDAIDRLHATNNFPEFTGRLCPAPCEGSCVLGINDDPVTIKAVEVAIIERAFDEGWVAPEPPAMRTGKKVAVVGSGPAGLAAAEQLNRAGHWVTVFERADRIGGLLRYGIPEFKMEKRVLDRRLALMEKAGVMFRPNAHVGRGLPVAELRREFDALVLACGAGAPRDLPIPGRELAGVHFAMEYLTLSEPALRGRRGARRALHQRAGQARRHHRRRRHRRRLPGHRAPPGRRRRAPVRAAPAPARQRAADNPWPQWPNVYRVSSAHEEGGERVYAVSTQRFTGDAHGRVRQLHAVKVEMRAARAAACSSRRCPTVTFTLDVDLVLLAMGFVGPERSGPIEELGLRLTERGNVARDATWMTSVPGVFTCGDMQRGQSLIVWAIAEGRSCAAGVDRWLMGKTDLPAPL